MFTACQNEKNLQPSDTDENITNNKKPFENLAKDDIEEITVFVSPPGDEILLTEDEIIELIPILKDIIIYEKVSPKEDLSGGLVRCTITMSDGSILKVDDISPYIVIDEVWYKAKYEPIEAFNQFGQNVVNTVFSNKK